MRKLPKKVLYAAGAVLIAVLAITAIFVFGTSDTGKVSSDSTQGGLLGDSTDGKPGFAIIDPANAEENGAKYDSERGFYVFRDTVAGKLIVVTQQLVPSDGFELNADELLAGTEYTTVSRMDTDIGPAYILKVDDGPQHALAFKYNNLYVFVTASEQISDQDWLDYINSLN